MILLNFPVAIFLSVICYIKGNQLGSYVNQTNTNQSCPSVFVIPDRPNSNRVEWVQGNKCASRCISPVWTNQEWKIIDIISLCATWIGFPFDILVLITWGFSRRKRRQYFVFYFAAFSLIAQTSMISMSFQPYEKVFCRDNAIPIGPEDGLTLCNAQSFLLLYGGMGGVISWTLQALDLFFLVIFKRNYAQQFKPVILCIIFVVPFSMALIMYITKSYGYQVGTIACTISGIYVTYLLYVPAVICITIGAICIFSVIGKITHHSISTSAKINNASMNSASTGYELYKMVKGAALFILSFFVFAFPVISVRYYAYAHIHNGASFPMADMKSWTECIFKYYDGDDASWRSKCGVHPPNRIPFGLLIFQVLSAHGTALLVSSTYLIQPSVWNIWREWLDRMSPATPPPPVNNTNTAVAAHIQRRRSSFAMPPAAPPLHRHLSSAYSIVGPLRSSLSGIYLRPNKEFLDPMLSKVVPVDIS